VRRLSEPLQGLLLKYIIEGKNEFIVSCEDKEKIRKLFIALGREVEIEKINEEECLIKVYSRVS